MAAPYAWICAVAALLALVLTPLVRRLSVSLGVVDEPGGRRVHETRVARLGGVAVFTSFLGALLIGLTASDYVYEQFFENTWRSGWLLAGGVIAFTTGLVDDLRGGVSPAAKVAGLTLAGGAVVASTYGVGNIVNPSTGETIALGWLAAPITVTWVVGITSAFNLIDGLDGLASGTALIASATLLTVALQPGRADVVIMIAAMTGALAGFLRYNFFPATIFLGDSGSFVLGYLMAVLALRASPQEGSGVFILVPLLALGFPIADTATSIVRRLPMWRRNRGRGRLSLRAIFYPDSDHIHHRLMQRGLTHRGAVLALYGVSILLGLASLAAFHATAAQSGVIVLFTFFAWGYGLRRLRYV